MSEPEAKRTLTDRLLAPFSDVRNGEGGRALVMLSTIFILLTCYYVLKTVREPLILAGHGRAPQSGAQKLAFTHGARSDLARNPCLPPGQGSIALLQ